MNHPGAIRRVQQRGRMLALRGALARRACAAYIRAWVLSCSLAFGERQKDWRRNAQGIDCYVGHSANGRVLGCPFSHQTENGEPSRRAGLMSIRRIRRAAEAVRLI